MPLAKPENTPLKYVVGMDIAKSSFVACLGQVDGHQRLHFGKETTFENTPSGFADLLRWVARQQATAAPLWFVVEATGVY
jgi:transposase